MHLKISRPDMRRATRNGSSAAGRLGGSQGGRSSSWAWLESDSPAFLRRIVFDLFQKERAAGTFAEGEEKHHGQNENGALPNGSEISPTPLRKTPAWKFVLDVTCILLSLPVWLPLMLLMMLVTRVSSPGPIFYRQERVGLGGRHFLMWKFRTMRLSAETQTHERHFEELIRTGRRMTKLDAHGDPRLAPFGRILRASGLDELPQIFNVLRGEMSLVGPRPCTPQEFVHYEPWQRERVNCLPGLTGFWQVNGKNKTTFNQMVAMDIFYLKNLSLLFDLKIMLKTSVALAAQIVEATGRKVHAPAYPSRSHGA